jgi:hypothetical protein
MSTPEIQPPRGMTSVTKDEFFALLKTDPRDIMPRSLPDHSTWETRDREVWGWSSPGWKYRGAQRYAVAALSARAE